MLFSDEIWSNSSPPNQNGWTKRKKQPFASNSKAVEKEQQKLSASKSTPDENEKPRRLKENPRVYRDKILFFMGGRWTEFRRDCDSHSHSDDSGGTSDSSRLKRQHNPKSELFGGFHENPMDFNWRESNGLAPNSDWRNSSCFKTSVKSFPAEINKPLPTPSISKQLSLSSPAKIVAKLRGDMKFKLESDLNEENEQCKISEFLSGVNNYYDDKEEEGDDNNWETENEEPVFYYLTRMEFSPPLVKMEKLGRENVNEKKVGENWSVTTWISSKIPSTRFWVSKVVFCLSLTTLIFSFVEWSLNKS